jgi:predicted enzyme related to lactoylglutathione lyase
MDTSPASPAGWDTSQPDPRAAAEFYGGLFGWEFEDLMPSGSEGDFLIARHEAKSSSIFDLTGALLSGDVAAVRSIPAGGPPMAIWNTYFWVDSADEAASTERDQLPRFLSLHGDSRLSLGE